MFGDHRAPKQFAASLEKLIACKAEYDTIIASHDEPILENDYAEKVLESWKEIQAKGYPYEEKDLFGTMIKAYAGTWCGFFTA